MRETQRERAVRGQTSEMVSSAVCFVSCRVIAGRLTLSSTPLPIATSRKDRGSPGFGASSAGLLGRGFWCSFGIGAEHGKERWQLPHPVGIAAPDFGRRWESGAKRAGAFADRSWPRRYRQPGLGRGDRGSHRPQGSSISAWHGGRGPVSATLEVQWLLHPAQDSVCWSLASHLSFARTPRKAS